MARESTYNNFKISLVVFMPNITTNHAITYTNFNHAILIHVMRITFEPCCLTRVLHFMTLNLNSDKKCFISNCEPKVEVAFKG